MGALLIVSIIANVAVFAEAVTTKNKYNEIVYNYTEKEKKLQDNLDMSEENLNKKFEQFYADKLRSFIDEKDLVMLAQKQWNYVLTVNGEPVTGSVYNTSSRNIKIVLAENENSDKILPEEILLKGTVTGGDSNDSLEEHFLVKSSVKFEMKKESYKSGNGICYEFKDIKEPTIITIYLSGPLKYRLGLEDKLTSDNDSISIIVK